MTLNRPAMLAVLFAVRAMMTCQFQSVAAIAPLLSTKFGVGLTDIGAPFISLYLLKRRSQGREDQMRFPERFGHASHPRPEERLLWCHAASVGEAASILARASVVKDNAVTRLRNNVPTLGAG